jgi:hypothetical protein
VAGADRMTVEEVVRKVLLDEHADVIRAAVKAVAREMVELEVSELIGADWVSEDRAGSYFPSFLEPRRRSEQALLAVVQRADPGVCDRSTVSDIYCGRYDGACVRSFPASRFPRPQ